MEQVPPDYAERLHADAVTPVSQYVHDGTWCVTLLGEEPEAVFGPILEGTKEILLNHGSRHINVTAMTKETILGIDQLLTTELPQRFRLRFLTPCAFKSKGNYQLLPTQHFMLQNLIRKWNGCFGTACPIDASEEGIEALAAELVIRTVRLDTAIFPLKGSTLPGVVGELELENRADGLRKQILNALLLFGLYSGIGIKTTLGMGGVIIIRNNYEYKERRPGR